jgi:hypothetical protein
VLVAARTAQASLSGTLLAPPKSLAMPAAGKGFAPTHSDLQAQAAARVRGPGKT